jgi:hypothetical protein
MHARHLDLLERCQPSPPRIAAGYLALVVGVVERALSMVSTRLALANFLVGGGLRAELRLIPFGPALRRGGGLAGAVAQREGGAVAVRPRSTTRREAAAATGSAREEIKCGPAKRDARPRAGPTSSCLKLHRGNNRATGPAAQTTRPSIGGRDFGSRT